MGSDLRSFLQKIDNNILKIKKQVNCEQNIGDLCSQSKHPLLFENIENYPDWKLYSQLLYLRENQAKAINTTSENLLEVIEKKFTKGPGKIVEVFDAPVKEKIYTGKQINIFNLPIVKHSPKDGGRFLGSAMGVLRDPESNFQNVSFFRIHVREKNWTAINIGSPHAKKIIQKYHSQNRAAPVALVIGHHPCFEIATNYWGNHDGYSEHELAASLLDETVEFICCETSKILVPARAEIVVEGEIPPNITVDEGPFGEFNCYYSPKTVKPKMDIKAITMRKDAIFRHVNASPFTEHQVLASLPAQARMYQDIKGMGALVHDVSIPSWGALFITVIKLTPNIEEQVKHILVSTLCSTYWPFSKMAIAVDHDVDIFDPLELFHSIATRVNPAQDITIIDRTMSFPSDISVPRIKDIDTIIRSGSKVAIDATKPPLQKKAQRSFFDRISPKGWRNVKLEDYIS